MDDQAAAAWLAWREIHAIQDRHRLPHTDRAVPTVRQAKPVGLSLVVVAVAFLLLLAGQHHNEAATQIPTRAPMAGRPDCASPWPPYRCPVLPQP